MGTSMRAGADLYHALGQWLTRVSGGWSYRICWPAYLPAMSASTPATCAAIGKMGIPEMRHRGYSDEVA